MQFIANGLVINVPDEAGRVGRHAWQLFVLEPNKNAKSLGFVDRVTRNGPWRRRNKGREIQDYKGMLCRFVCKGLGGGFRERMSTNGLPPGGMTKSFVPDSVKLGARSIVLPSQSSGSTPSLAIRRIDIFASIGLYATPNSAAIDRQHASQGPEGGRSYSNDGFRDFFVICGKPD